MTASSADDSVSAREGASESTIYVLAGVNGSGKSSVLGEWVRRVRGTYFNPDEATRRLLAEDPKLSLDQANSAAWHDGQSQLKRAIEGRSSYAFETTLGGHSVVDTLERALMTGLDVRMWFVGLSTPEQHLARIRARVAAGGHDIPEAKVRERFDSGRMNVIRLLPRLTELRVYDNSTEADPVNGVAPQPRLLLHTAAGRVLAMCSPADVPDWAKPILLVAMRRR